MKFTTKSEVILIILKITLIYLYLYSNKLFNTNIKICLCTIGKNENSYIKEFVTYYKELGYNHIYLYDNNDIDNEKFEDIIYNEINKGFVTLINYRGIRGENINPQLEAYKDCYEKYNMKYDWLSFFDIDEYLELIPKTLKIHDFLSILIKDIHNAKILK